MLKINIFAEIFTFFARSPMLTRRLIRVKVLQTAYLYEIHQITNSEHTFGAKEAVEALQQSLDAFLCLEYFLWELFPLFSQKAQEFLLEEERKHFPRQEMVDRLRPLAEDRFVLAIHNNNALLESGIEKDLQEELNTPSFAHIFQSLQSLPAYPIYCKACAIGERREQFDAMKRLMKSFYEWLFQQWYEEVEAEEKILESLPHNSLNSVSFGSSYFQKFFLEAPISYTSDLYAAVQHVCERIDKLKELPVSETKLAGRPLQEDDMKFATSLLLRKLQHSVEHQELIKANLSSEWTIGRLKKLDLLIIELAITELLYFPEIPIRVTLNEYVDIASQFTARESLAFINGIVDNIFHQLDAQGRIQKNFETNAKS
ncbi:MAG: transcription antitermination protein NusB [Bacteroides sp.]